MIRLIVSILLFIILAVFVALNAQYTTTVDLFGYEFKQVSVAAVVTVTLAVGVLYSFTLYVSNFLSKSRAERLKNQKRKNKEKATELAEKEKGIQEVSAPVIEAPDATETQPKKRRGVLGKGRVKAPKEEVESTPDSAVAADSESRPQ